VEGLSLAWGFSALPQGRFFRTLKRKTNAMTIDERIQALTESLELLSSLHRDLEEQTTARFQETAARFADLGQFINSLAHIAEGQ
jgi:hypothetical protein